MDKKVLIFKCYKIICSFPFVNHISKKCTIINKGSILIGCKIVSHSRTNKLLLPPNGLFKNCTFELYGTNEEFCFSEGIRAYNASFYAEDDNSSIVIGNSTFAGKIHIASTEGKRILIGDECLFSSDITIRNGDSHSIINTDGERINQAQDVEISDHCWIGYRVLFTKGSRIGKNSIVGTGTVVTKKFQEENVIIAGVPGKVIRNYVNWDEKRI